VLQAINRKRNDRPIEAYYHSKPRGGNKEVQFAGVNLKTEKQVLNFIQRTDISTKGKLSKKFKEYHPYININDVNEKTELVLNREIFALVESEILIDKGIHNYKEYFAKRGVTLVDFNRDNNFKKPRVRMGRVKRQQHYFDNIKEIEKNIDNYLITNNRCQMIKVDTPKNGEVLKESVFIDKLVESTQKNWNYFVDIINFRHDFGTPDKKNGNLIFTSEFRSMDLANSFINNERALRQFFKETKIKSIKRYEEKELNPRTEEARKAKKAFKDSRYYLTSAINLLVSLANPISSTITGASATGDREFSTLTNTSTEVRKDVLKILGFNAVCMDVKQCNPNIDANLSGMANLELYSGRIGKARSEAKLDLLKELNKLKIETSSDESFRKTKSVKKALLMGLGYDETTASNVVNRFCASPYKSAYYEEHSFYEKALINKFRYYITEVLTEDMRVLRLHDSLIITSLSPLPHNLLKDKADSFKMDLKDVNRVEPLGYEVGDVKETTWFGFEVWNEVTGTDRPESKLVKFNFSKAA